MGRGPFLPARTLAYAPAFGSDYALISDDLDDDAFVDEQDVVAALEVDDYGHGFPLILNRPARLFQ